MAKVTLFTEQSADRRGDWSKRAACRGVDTNLFFPTPERPADERARRLCAGCPVKAECFDYARRSKQPAGMWGGVIVKQQGSVRETWRRMSA